ncbi:MAG TPA: AMP-binding protein, partial [bacterium]|nr:AMP-binding protein [bacterium]
MRQAEQQTWSDQARINHQGQRFERLARDLAHQNAFYVHKWREIPKARLTFDRLAEFPFTTKRELLEDQQAHPPFGSNLTFAVSQYNRFHQTSGTSGRPLRVLDTPQSWQWWADCWRLILDAAGVSRADRAMLAFSFGPFIGFWAAQEGAQQAGALVLPGGGLSSAQRLALMREVGATVLICTPSYALHLAEVARAEGLDPARDLQVRTTIHAGEPGAGIPATRDRIEALWGAQAFDHPGASEVGAYGFSCSARCGVHVNEAEFIAEVLDPETQQPVAPGQPGELVITNLGRLG